VPAAQRACHRRGEHARPLASPATDAPPSDGSAAEEGHRATDALLRIRPGPLVAEWRRSPHGAHRDPEAPARRRPPPDVEGGGASMGVGQGGSSR
jgi:hypothetical protein